MDAVVVATTNKGKLGEFLEFSSKLPWLLEGYSGPRLEVAETGLTYAENAILKARAFCDQIKKPTLADDSGLEVMALHGRPGIHSARFAGVGATDSTNIDKLLDEMKDIQDRRARFCCVLALMRYPQDPMPILGQGYLYGEILRERKGTGGFGYNPIFYIPALGKTLAELSENQRLDINHRWIAMKDLFEQFTRAAHG